MAVLRRGVLSRLAQLAEIGQWVVAGTGHMTFCIDLLRVVL